MIEQLLRKLKTLLIGQPPEIKCTRNATVAINAGAGAFSYATVEADTGRLDNLEILVRYELPPKGTPEIFVSFAWGDDSSQAARQRTEVVDRLCERLDEDGWNIIRDKNAIRYGDLISAFMKTLSQADCVIVVLSDKYLRSPYCMAELYSIYQRSVGEKEDFLHRIIPLVLLDAQFGSPEERVEYAKHWEARYLKLKSNLDYLAVEDFRLYQDMKRWYLDVGNMLSYINDVLVPHGFDEIVKDDFAALRQMLEQRR